METQNVSAQLYFKQLNANNLEDAFQNQLNMAEHFKTSGVFDAVKNQFMDPTNSQESENIGKNISLEDTKPFESSKSNFGMGSNSWWIIIAIILILIASIFAVNHHTKSLNHWN
jgi:hypothetical protein